MGESGLRELEKELKSLLRPFAFITACYQFGSTVRGGAGPLSDLDLAILVKEEDGAPSGLELLMLEGLLAYELGKRLHYEVDLITLNRLRLPLQYAILKGGRLVYEADPAFRRKFTYRVVREYLDFQPTLQLIGKFHTQGRLKRCDLKLQGTP